MLTEEGFKHTAAWRDSGEVMKFVTRLLKDDMKATLKLGETTKRIQTCIDFLYFIFFN